MRLLSSLTNRIFIAAAALAVLSVGSAAYIVNERVTREAEAELRRGLIESGSVVDQQRVLLVDTFLRLARLVADLPKLKAAIETGDPPTIQPIARDYDEQIRADLFVVTGRTGQVLASTGAPGFSPDLPGVREALGGTVGSAFWPHRDGLLQVVTVPVAIENEILGSLSVGFLLDDKVADQFKAVTGSDIAFAAGGHVLASTLPPADRAQLSAVLGRAGVSRVTLAGEEYIALRHPLTAQPAAGAPVEGGRAGDRPIAILLRSRTERLRFLAPIRAALAGTAVAAVLIATMLSYAVARTITRPLAAVTDVMRETARTGDLARKVALRPARWDDEDARLLASTFNAMTDSIARFQRDAAQRDRLSSLGRLSTVIAHEVRNPLMIIKTALRTLRRDDAVADDVREAVRDIDEETTRLDRVVAEVLDFARPIRFDLAPTDLNAVCRASATAAMADGAEPAVGLSLSPELPEIVCDGERLRTALVNMLSNARQAVQARAAGAAPGAAPSGAAEPSAGGAADVVLRTERGGSGRAAIVIRDRGTGMTADDLAHVFDPYFTTRRAGTGLGLPIAKNLIEGLGGSIAIASRPGEGTEIRIELPINPPA